MQEVLSQKDHQACYNNWDNYQLQINKYLATIDENPYVDYLKTLRT